MSENHEAIVTDAKPEEAAWLSGCARACAPPDAGWWQPAVVAGAAEPQDSCQEPGRGEPAR